MWETSKTPALVRTARCSSMIELYWTGISQPANGTSRAPAATWRSCSGVRFSVSAPAAIGDGTVPTLPCRPYDGAELHWLVASCRAPDGSYWALQSWQRMLPNYGLRPSPKQAVWELRLSHWTGEPAVLEVATNWAYRRFDHIFGRFSYLASPVYGFRSTSAGVPLDSFGRNLYVDTFNSAYGRGWKRENSFLMHSGSGAFCYGFFRHGTRPAGAGERYRATIIGPGVTPDVFWQSEAPGPYSRELDALANDAIRGLGSDTCRPN